MLHFIAGMLFVALGLWGMYAWWDSFGLVLRGVAPIGLILVGLVAALSGFYRMARIRGDVEPEEMEPDDWESEQWEPEE